MTRNELIAIIQNELKDNPKATCLEIALKHKIPVDIAEIFRRKIIKEQKLG